MSGIIWACFLYCHLPKALKNINSIVSINKTQKKIIKNLLMAQMTLLALFGPIFVTHISWAIENKNSI